jgi:ATP-binding cassette subfamily F protein uup
MTVLMKNPNFLILDEPTNDLDIFTLGVLEEYLALFGGCVLVVSHDRYFLDRVVDQLFVFEGGGKIKSFPGNYSHYQEHLKKLEKPNPSKEKKSVVVKPVKETEKPRRMTYKEKQEFEKLEKRIAELEKEKVELENGLSSGALSQEALLAASNRLGLLMSELDQCENRWIELSEIA